MNFKLKEAIYRKYGFQYAFAHAIGIREENVSRLIHGRDKFTVKMKKRWAKALDVKVEDVFSETD